MRQQMVLLLIWCICMSCEGFIKKPNVFSGQRQVPSSSIISLPRVARDSSLYKARVQNLIRELQEKYNYEKNETSNAGTKFRGPHVSPFETLRVDFTGPKVHVLPTSDTVEGCAKELLIQDRFLLGGLLPEEERKRFGLNNRTYIEFKFPHPVYLLEWETRGRLGSSTGDAEYRRGFVDSYYATYMSAKQHRILRIEDPVTQKEEFLTAGNLALPDVGSIVSLPTPILTTSLRLIPKVWSGVPFMAASVKVCTLETKLPNGESRVSKTKTKTVSTGVNSKYEEYCLTPLLWRYAEQTTPMDKFSARVNPDHAWRAVLGVYKLPYLFPSGRGYLPKDRFLHIDFKSTTLITALMVGGAKWSKNSKKDWGMVTRFSLLYKNRDSNQWSYYEDDKKIPRVFTLARTDIAHVGERVIYRLPRMLATDSLGFFPHKWIHKPFLSVDIQACYIETPEISKARRDTGYTPMKERQVIITDSGPRMVKTTATKRFGNEHSTKIFKSGSSGISNSTFVKTIKKGVPTDEEACQRSLVSKEFRELTFGNIPQKIVYNNNFYSTSFKLEGPKRVTAIVVAGSGSMVADEIVNTFALEYKKDQFRDWKLVVDNNGKVVVFQPAFGPYYKPVIIKLPKPIIARDVRVLPKKWTGNWPKLYMDLLGCTG